MTYDPGSKVYYGTKGSESDRLVPAPQVSFTTEMVYANDTVAGYTYIVTLNGYATALDKTSNITYSYGLVDVSNRVQKIRDIFSLNGAHLYIMDSGGNNILMECRGGTVKSIVFEESPNNWVNYVPYKIEIEFSEIIINGCSVANSLNCNELTINSNSVAPNLIDITKYKIKSFNDNWSFNISEAAYNSYGSFQNQYIDVEYTVSATGKNFYTEEKKLLPAWEQAKNFVQQRVYDQVKGLISNILNRNSSSAGCSPDKTLSQLHSLGTPGGIDGIDSLSHQIYNESISCEAGEAEGTFSATYKAILKNTSNNQPLATDCLHTFTKNKSIQDDNKIRTVSISVQGSITGLIPGGLIRSPNIIEFPKNGKIFLTHDSNTSITKYDKALNIYNQINNNGDISQYLKNIIGITGDELELSGSCSTIPIASSYSSTHDYTSGVITYSAEYNSNRACMGDSSYRNITISVEDSVPMIAEFVVPGRAAGPIIQKIGVNSPKRVSVNIEGVSSQLCCPSLDNSCDSTSGLPFDLPTLEIENMKLTQNQVTTNTIDGSYSINRSYIAYDE
jgi:hypothetical protein